ncbi:unnamed protein product [Mytilus coruscus]|uniref:SWIM-type domain-containing protein n=1 Tax=Mytilus coruscus TaxID=42192 RepID=A0A6J8EL59_MYTCO|nr:unnamed protein product [Mytilus coruscus]
MSQIPKKNESPHEIEISLVEGPGLESSNCSCAIGKSGTCGHFTGLLYTLAHMKASNLKSIPSDILKTSLPQTWHIPRDFPILPIDNFMLNTLQVALNRTKTTSFNAIQVSMDETRNIEVMTRLQSDDPRWHAVRRDRLTASVAGDIVKRRADNEPLVARLKTTRKVASNSLSFLYLLLGELTLIHKEWGCIHSYASSDKTLFNTKPLSAIIESPSSKSSTKPQSLVISTSDILPVYNEEIKIRAPCGAIPTRLLKVCVLL